MIASLALPTICLAALSSQDLVGGVPYETRDTREATLELMLDRLVPEPAEWGEWHLLSPFPFDEETGLDVVHPPEEELDAMQAGGPGPDLDAVHVGKKGVEVRWRSLGDATNRRVVLNDFDDPELNDWATAYLYVPVTSDEAKRVVVPFGSDDGVRVYLNGEVAFEADWMRGMTAGEDSIELDLSAGVNHVLFEVYQGVGGWEFQIDTRPELDAAADAELFYRLDRDFPPSPERDHYAVMSYPLPDDLVLEVGGLDFLGDGRPVVATRRGDVVVVDDAYEEPPVGARFTRFASGLHEPLGLAVRRDADGEAVYAVQRGELTRLLDVDGDDRADVYETFCDDWGVSGNYHEFSFGPEFDREGNAWVTLNVGFCGSLGKSLVPWRGWAVKITPEGELIPVCDGLRSPNGIGLGPDGEMFYVDNQGDYVGTNRLNHLAPGSWAGHPASLRWRDGLEEGEMPERHPPSVWFPYGKMGQSAADIALCDEDGRFGPFDGQLFVGDQTHASVMRVFLEKVEGQYQGACFPFLSGLACGVNRVAFAPDGSMLVGETDRGWGSVGRKRYGLERIVHTGEEPFEILAMRATEEGFELELTRDVDPTTALDPASYELMSYTYAFHAEYGAPESDTLELAVTRVEPGPTATVVRLAVEPLRAGYVHELHADGLRSADGEPLLHAEAYYTLERIPGRPARVQPVANARTVEEAEETGEAGEALPRVVFLTHSAGYRHEVVTRAAPDELSVAERALVDAADGNLAVTATQDCDWLDAERLEGVDALVLFTTGELPAPEGGRQALLAWVRGGGALVGVHSATDTFHEFPLYLDMIGGEFASHPWNGDVSIAVDATRHPAVAHLGGLGATFRIADEIYQHSRFRPWPTVPLLRLDSARSDPELAKADPPGTRVPLAWCREYGEGRVFYTALGHRPEVWEDERFLQHLLGGLEWALDGGEVPLVRPVDAEVLFAGRGTEAWRARGGGPAPWVVQGKALEVSPGTGDLVSAERFGDARLHIEFRVPESAPEATGQARGNSGVYVQGRYELQVLDSYGEEPGIDGCAAIYGVKAPDHGVARAPGEWQSYDVLFRAPRFDASGAKSEDARMTAWHNGVLVHDDVAVPGATRAGLGPDEVSEGPLLLQDHGHAVQYRNVWVLPGATR